MKWWSHDFEEFFIGIILFLLLKYLQLEEKVCLLMKRLKLFNSWQPCQTRYSVMIHFYI